MNALAASLVVLALSRVAAAQPDDSDIAGDRSPTVATAISITATAGSVALGVTGIAMRDSSHAISDGLLVASATSLIFTPSLGHAYGEHALLTDWTLGRAAGALALAGSSLWFAELESHVGASSPQPRIVVVPVLGATAGLIALVAGTVLDITTAGSATSRWNRKHALAPVPVAINGPTGATIPGVGIRGRF